MMCGYALDAFDSSAMFAELELSLHETFGHWSVAVLTVTVHFIYFHF